MALPKLIDPGNTIDTPQTLASILMELRQTNFLLRLIAGVNDEDADYRNSLTTGDILFANATPSTTYT